MSETHAHHILRAQTIHNDATQRVRDLEAALRTVVYLTNEPERLGRQRAELMGEIRNAAERGLLP